nr:hypothetical protein BaRGS_033351 [Batillaria attramentaria]
MVQWKNPGGVSDQQDNPGLNLFFTPQLRQFDSSTLKLGNEFAEPVQVKPGDVIKTTCRYSSLNKTTTTFNTNAAPHEHETCYAYLRFLPGSGCRVTAPYLRVLEICPRVRPCH